jgi:hypothetical protein
MPIMRWETEVCDDLQGDDKGKMIKTVCGEYQWKITLRDDVIRKVQLMCDNGKKKRIPLVKKEGGVEFRWVK